MGYTIEQSGSVCCPIVLFNELFYNSLSTNTPPHQKNVANERHLRQLIIDIN